MGNNSRYKQYRVNRHRFRTEQVTFPIVLLIVIGIISKFWYLIVIGIVVFIVHQIAKYFNGSNENSNIIVEKEEEMENIYEEESGEMKTLKSTYHGYINKNNQQNNGRSSKSGTDHNQWFYNMNC